MLDNLTVLMRHRIPSLQSLLILDAAVTHGSFSKAAESLSLTHGAVSQQIRALQTRLGVQLFIREGQRMRATPACLALIAQVRQAIWLLDRTFPPSPRRSGRARLTVSVLPHFATGWLIGRLPRFVRQDGRFSIDLVGSHLIDDLAEGGADCAIRFGPGGWPGLVSERLSSEISFPVCAPDFFRLIGGSLGRATRDSYLRSPFPPWEPWLQAANERLSPEASGPYFGDPSLLLAALRAGQGIGVVRYLIVADDLREGRLLRLSETHVEEPYGYYVVWRPDNPRKKLIRSFCEWLRLEIVTTFAEINHTAVSFAGRAR
jgi:LysR family transcriptional regulator, glycine cleavage system transcriptional activator